MVDVETLCLNFFENFLLCVITIPLQDIKKYVIFSKRLNRIFTNSVRKLQFGIRTTIQIVKRQSKVSQIKNTKRTFRVNIDDSAEDNGSVLRPYLPELCRMKIMSCRMTKKIQYTAYQK